MKIKASMRDYGHKMAVPTYISTYICKISIYICNTDKMRVIHRTVVWRVHVGETKEWNQYEYLR